MDIHILDTINMANSNIEELITKIVLLQKLKDGELNCCYGALKFRPEDCDSNCKRCKEKYYRKMHNDMLDKYIVNL